LGRTKELARNKQKISKSEGVVFELLHRGEITRKTSFFPKIIMMEVFFLP
jgi:hypothetical protein